MIESLEKLGKRALTFPEKASSIIIHDAKTLKGANNFLLGIKGMLKEIKDAFSPIIEQTHKAHKEALNQRKKYDEPLLAAEKTVKLQIGVYVRKLEEIRQEAERKIYEAEVERLQKEAEIEAQAQRLENHGHRREAEEVRETKPTPVVETLPDAPSLNGISISRILKWEVSDFNQVPRLYLMVDSSKVGAAVRANKGEIEIPGIRIYKEDSVSARAVTPF